MDIWKNVDELRIGDIMSFPVWEYVYREELGLDETVVQPVHELPISSAEDRIIGAKLRMNNGIDCWGTLDGISLTSTRKTYQFIGICVLQQNEKFCMARYFEPGYESHGPAQLAAFLGMKVDDVFPISYDISAVAVGVPDVLKGTVQIDVMEKLTLNERLQLGREPD